MVLIFSIFLPDEELLPARNMSERYNTTQELLNLICWFWIVTSQTLVTLIKYAIAPLGRPVLFNGSMDVDVFCTVSIHTIYNHSEKWAKGNPRCTYRRQTLYYGDPKVQKHFWHLHQGHVKLGGWPWDWLSLLYIKSKPNSTAIVS